MTTNKLEGWKLVPVEPTTEMLRAAQDAWLADPLRRTTSMYKAMVDTAPQPAEQQPAQDVWKQAVDNVAGYAHLYSNGHGVIHEIRAENARLTTIQQPAPEAQALRKDAERLLAALVAVRAALEYENGKGITDTLWMIPSDYTGTVFDYIDAAIDVARGKYNEQI